MGQTEYVGPKAKPPLASPPLASPPAFEKAAFQPRSGAEESRVSPGDVLEISVFQVDDLHRVVEVNANGQIEFPLIGKVDAGGKTIAQLEADIEQRLGATYLQSPDVTVTLKDAPSQRVTVEGAVVKPGIYPVRGRTTLLQAIAMAQGLAEVADVNDVTVFRMVQNQRTSSNFDIRTIRSGKAPDPEIVAGDLVVAGQSAIRTFVRNWGPALGIAGRAATFVP